MLTLSQVASVPEQKESVLVPTERRARERWEYERVLRFAEESAKLTKPELNGFEG